MYSGVKDIPCNHCDHLQVCSLKKEFNAAQQAIDNICVSLGDRTMKNLRDFNWIKPVVLECVHFTKQRPTMRGISTQNSASGIAFCAGEGKFMEDPT